MSYTTRLPTFAKRGPPPLHRSLFKVEHDREASLTESRRVWGDKETTLSQE